jgi:hypothetical protein
MPDMLRADFGAEGRGASVEEALRGANSALARITDALAKAGVDPADMQTANVEIFPRYKRGGGISGYQVSHQLTVKIRQLDKAGATLSAAVDAGGNAARLFGVSFTIEDDSALLAEARKKAFSDAKAKAELYGQQAGRPLGQRHRDGSRRSPLPDCAAARLGGRCRARSPPRAGPAAARCHRHRRVGVPLVP